MQTIITKKMADLLAYYDLTQGELADALHTSRLTVNQLCNGHRNMTADMALRLQQFSGISAKTWMDLQLYLDLHKARVAGMKTIKLIKPRRKHAT